MSLTKTLKAIEESNGYTRLSINLVYESFGGWNLVLDGWNKWPDTEIYLDESADTLEELEIKVAHKLEAILCTLEQYKSGAYHATQRQWEAIEAYDFWAFNNLRVR